MKELWRVKKQETSVKGCGPGRQTRRKLEEVPERSVAVAKVK